MELEEVVVPIALELQEQVDQVEEQQVELDIQVEQETLLQHPHLKVIMEETQQDLLVLKEQVEVVLEL